MTGQNFRLQVAGDSGEIVEFPWFEPSATLPGSTSRTGDMEVKLRRRKMIFRVHGYSGNNESPELPPPAIGQFYVVNPDVFARYTDREDVYRLGPPNIEVVGELEDGSGNPERVSGHYCNHLISHH